MRIWRWSGLAMALALALSGRWVDAWVAMLVALAQVVAWRSDLPRRWEAATTIVALVAAVSSYAHLYERVPGWDVPVHAALTGCLAVLAAHVLRRPSTRTIICAGAVMAVGWEVLELWGHQQVDARVEVAPWDTAGDIAAGLGGSLVAARLVACGRHVGGTYRCAAPARTVKPHPGPEERS